ncbi:Hydrogenase maturation protein, carbamoyltransferase HypF [Chitinophaga costaii]|uniref:Carbamoyltransferase n=1 Tax=Chitinophaga costaii TaxID=1335309 RepID=A0A1C4FJP3_9BACT|nr:carbamoyltransferase HypF [Chitinophaga costaii]PUZ30013.1 carbamoyltransferase HypF [Chitinophaga costaii]SCC56170.1 Hydrogenase maturation protein, carbamoyltransferase HypF [Chitinophaga costaii]
MIKAQTITRSKQEAPLISTVAIHLTGIVQGVGFRPFVYKVAQAMGLTGFVRNDNSGVWIEINGSDAQVAQFYHHLLQQAPPQARIQTHTIRQKTFTAYTAFEIIASSQDTAAGQPAIAPDFALCARCKAAMHDRSNRRYHYPFITCTDCGPRYSLLQSLPFDRANTAMHSFPPCPQCQAEYKDAGDVRFYAQTNSCPVCGITLQLYDQQQQVISSDTAAIIPLVTGALQAGKIIAVKGIGGFLLLCDAANQQSIQTLRQKKHRPTKPFAVMYPSIQQVVQEYEISPKEQDALQSAAAPIVLLRRKNTASSLAWQEVAPALQRVGVMLPYAPLLELILTSFDAPVVATSANISGDSLIYDNEKALQELPALADLLLLHNRDIWMPQDDSVIQFSTITQTRIILRSGRGLSPVHFPDYATQPTVFATGALLKSSVAVAHQGGIYVSQYLGNTDEYDTQQTYQAVASKILHLLQAKPGSYVHDHHPAYFSTGYAKQQAMTYQASLHSVQHHQAHFAAVLAENNLLDSQEKILGVIWDGSGLGDDGQIWGGEFFTYHHHHIERTAHLAYTPNPWGDKMAKEPRLSALASCKGLLADSLQQQFTAQEWTYYQKTLHHTQTYTPTHTPTSIHHSSMGRLFDAVAALLGLATRQTYEGEAALQLEQAATAYWQQHPFFQEYYPIHIHPQNNTISVAPMLVQIIKDLQSPVGKGKIALKFHLTLLNMIQTIAQKAGTSHIALSGGVFQNGLLIDLLKTFINNNNNNTNNNNNYTNNNNNYYYTNNNNNNTSYHLYLHQKLPPNDENISFGQLIIQTFLTKT